MDEATSSTPATWREMLAVIDSMLRAISSRVAFDFFDGRTSGPRYCGRCVGHTAANISEVDMDFVLEYLGQRFGCILKLYGRFTDMQHVAVQLRHDLVDTADNVAQFVLRVNIETI
jgi:hypothetical protein